MIPDFTGGFLNFESTQDGDIVEIISEGKMEYNQTLKKDMFNLQVRKGEKVMTYSPNNKSGKSLQKAFGMDTAKWIGRKFQVMHLEGRMVIRPITEEKV